jgi:hypothetical protein
MDTRDLGNALPTLFAELVDGASHRFPPSTDSEDR